LAPKAASDAWRRAQSVNEAMRTVKANFDFSPGTIQGLNVLARAPHKWGEVTAKSFEWLFKPENAPKWFAKHGDIISRHPDIVQGTHEYYAGQEVIKTKLGKPGRAIAKAMTPFENYFTNWGDAARVLMAEALEPSFVKAGTPERLGTYINRMTGVMDTRALGVSGKQRAFESLMLFAPRYTRASVAYIGTAMEGGVMGAEARKTIALLIGAGTLFWMGMQKAMGEEPAWPNSPNFWTVKMGNRRVGMGGFMYSFIRLLADSYQSIASEGGNAPSDFKEWDRTNPIINFLSKRTSVLWRAALTVRDETDFMGYPIEGFDEWAHYFMVEMMAPISIQEQLTGANEDAPSNRLGVAAAELFGLRTFPENEYYALADKYAQAAYGKDWNELSKPTKSGSYTQSPEQKRLLQMHPDLKAAYDAQKDRASERWKAQHDLLGDKNISRDAWAREMFGKDYKDLPKEYQKQVDEAIARG
ncbi:MAG: hypothetical protein M0R06_12865, partial [Sphaerochaeta sp.]|nr:hypothetical protein [Sphaerochaeta sp.]